eukprot:tig00020951_g16467.t1
MNRALPSRQLGAVARPRVLVSSRRASTKTAPASGRDVIICSVARTPLGSFGGTLSGFTACELGAHAVRAAVERAGVESAAVEECIMGNVLSANLGQAPARQACIGGGLPHSTSCTTVNKVCSSGMKAVMQGALTIMANHAQVVVAGGMEVGSAPNARARACTRSPTYARQSYQSMSNAPFYLPKARFGYKYGAGEVRDGIVIDGLWDPYGNRHMGECAEICAAGLGITRAAMDAHAKESYERSIAATESGLFDWEMVPLTPPGAKAPVKTDEEVGRVKFDKIPTLKPVFRPQGVTITAANSSPITDGAAALVLASRAEADRLGLRQIARILSFADAEQHPDWYTTSPALAVGRALGRAGLAAADVDFWEINQAFSSVSLANIKLLGLDPARVDVYGGAVSLGHPIGASGARILCTLSSVLREKGAAVGVAAVCNGGGGASAVVVERL